jgi:hypothetical protein
LQLTGFSAIGGNTGAGDARNGGETKYYSKKYDWKQVVGFCKVIDVNNKDINYTKSPPVNLPPSISTTTTSTPTLSPKEIKEKSANGFNNLTYGLSLIYQLKDDYGSGTYNKDGRGVQVKKYLFYDAKGANDDELEAVKLLEQWLENQTQKVYYEKLTTNDALEFQKSLRLLISRTKTGGDEITFESRYNDEVKKVTIDPDF